MIEQKHYNDKFYSDQQEGSFISAQKVISFINEVFHPNSVVDVGCGVGYWLKVWDEKFGVKDIFGIEGPYVNVNMLHVSPKLVRFQDLKLPFEIDRRFDIAMSLEVAEHLPESCSDNFVQSLIKLSDIIIFSAAIIGQVGTYHINEQMPDYWANKFKRHNYIPIDYIRPKIWLNDEIDWWYRQNILIYIKQERLKDFPALQNAYELTAPDNLLKIHPKLYFDKLNQLKKTKSIIGYFRWKLYPWKIYFKKMFDR